MALLMDLINGQEIVLPSPEAEMRRKKRPGMVNNILKWKEKIASDKYLKW